MGLKRCQATSSTTAVWPRITLYACRLAPAAGVPLALAVAPELTPLPPAAVDDSEPMAPATSHTQMRQSSPALTSLPGSCVDQDRP